ncbi:photosystem reaction center subunit H [Methylobacterium oxalidis]|uniref:Photosystem reaction center subunit H n=1 Tax=Methylobacterium oxalidis TaxID=944322 RepID=A0A512J6Q9_9HYPH|nr:photosystem reaction center subunit H [Methylobacterium oxalidis]GEP05647.1 hypothetical protein MOX02_36850 [Methylobacterium oxalidis]GJE32474.1 hypothetical protein LDDCCGHA_2660 [Methylobacterium oxalidis]GLS63126.1 hypothetical protein GCM10007888_15070 [Methylobacterium oxalidis]
MRRPARISALLLPLLAGAPAEAACDLTGIRLEERIAETSELRESANKQTVRDLRTLRDAAIVLDAYKYEAECERLVGIVKALAANPVKAIEQGGDTDEEKAESVEETREPKAPAEPGKPR